MERSYWEKIAPDYNDEIFDVLLQDKKGLIKKEIAKIAGPRSSMIDIGCAVGKWLPVLSPLFKKVLAVDISAKNVSIAKKNYPGLKNIEYQRVDMSSPSYQLNGFDAALCVNAILSGSLLKRQRFFQNIYKSLKKDGHLILVVPSLESWLLTRIIQHQWKIDQKLFSTKVKPADAVKRYADIQQGNVEIDNVATKHYLGDELDLLLQQNGFEVVTRKKISYDWSTEFVEAPQWLQEPQPWDWMAVARKVK
jgi:SAM-dependent methyltransferase